MTDTAHLDTKRAAADEKSGLVDDEGLRELAQIMEEARQKKADMFRLASEHGYAVFNKVATGIECLGAALENEPPKVKETFEAFAQAYREKHTTEPTEQELAVDRAMKV